MSPSASQPVGAAPGGLEPTTGGREPLPFGGSPPGTPPERPLFQSALESERARTAIAEGQQQSHSPNTPPAGGEPASTAEAFDPIPHSSERPAPRRSEHSTTPPPAGTKAATGFAPSAPMPAGSTPIPATTLPGATPTGELVVGVTGELPVGASGGSAMGAGGGTAEGASGGSAVGASGAPAEGASGKRTAGASPLPARVGMSASAVGANGTSNPTAPTTTDSSTHTDALPAAAVTHGDAPLSTPTSPVAVAAAHDSASAAGALATSRDGSPDASGSAGALAVAAKDASLAGNGAPTRSTPAGSLGTHLTPHGSSTLSAGTGDAGTHDKLWVANPSQASSYGVANGGGLPENTAPSLMPAATDGNPAALAGELGAGGYGVGLQEAIESLHGTIQLTARQGLTQARISLQPEELGEIRINLTQTAQGLLARVTAESPAAAQALAAAHAQLRQSLSSLGINLTRLDIGHHDPARGGGADANGGGQGGAARGEGFAGSRPGRPTTIAAHDEPETETESPAVEALTPATTAPSHGTLIDVLA